MDDNVTNTDQMMLGNSTASSFEYATNATVSVRTQEKAAWEYDIYTAAVWMFYNNWKIIAPPGLLGNLLTVFVTLKMKPYNSTSLFMISMAVVDLLLICSRIALKAVQLDSTMLCKSMWYFYNALPLFSNYILILWTIERFIAVLFPLRVLELYTMTRTAITIVAVGIFSFAVNIAWAVSIVKFPNGIGCTIYKDKRVFIYNVWYKVDTSLFIFIPISIICVCNSMIIYRLKKSTRRHQQMTSNEESRQKREKEQRNTTITLLAVCFAFLILHTPLAIYNCMAMTAAAIPDNEVRANWYFINYLGLTMSEVQNSINFYLYFLTGRRYREATFSLFVSRKTVPTCKNKERTSPMYHENGCELYK